ncbi:MAG: hypothetical protein KKD65_07820 [Gammaproteobacteria bacterium]|nr:hypothetical protein [Gammaproteobacteria bacterium]
MSSLSSWPLYESQSSFILGFHGCDQSVGEAILRGKTSHLKPSTNDYDWLGHGIYFWEGNPQRALDFAIQRAKGGSNSKGSIKKPFVLGAIIDLKHCLDLLDSSGLQQVADSHTLLKKSFESLGFDLPVNKGNKEDLTQRFLDCAVIDLLHSFRKEEKLDRFDSVRAAFWEGADLYPNAGFKSHNHIQICVCSSACIKGYFRPIPG